MKRVVAVTRCSLWQLKGIAYGGSVLNKSTFLQFKGKNHPGK